MRLSTREIGIVLIAGGIVLLVVGQVLGHPVWGTVMLQVGGVAIGAGTVELVMYAHTTERVAERAAQRTVKALQLNVDGFYETRSELPPLSAELADCREIWCTWHVGTVAETLPFFTNDRRGRVVLTNPNSCQMTVLETVSPPGATAIGMSQDIRQLSQRLQAQGVEVRWFDGSISNSTLLANPCSDNAWARIELMVPKGAVGDRPSIKLLKRDAPKAYFTLRQSFLEVWGASGPPRY